MFTHIKCAIANKVCVDSAYPIVCVNSCLSIVCVSSCLSIVCVNSCLSIDVLYAHKMCDRKQSLLSIDVAMNSLSKISNQVL